MAEEKLVAEALSPELITAGKDLLVRLDESEFRIDAALWMFVPESGLWRLVLATPDVRSHGPRRAYRRLLSHLKHLGNPKLSLSDISIVDTRDSLISTLRVGLKTGPGIAGIRFTGNAINGVLFPDAYVYRVV